MINAKQKIKKSAIVSLKLKTFNLFLIQRIKYKINY
jgi:hypothetical protein